MNILASQTMGRKRPSTQGRSIHAVMSVSPGVDGAPALHTATGPEGLVGRGPSHMQAMEDLNRQVAKAIHTPPAGTDKVNL